MGVVVGLGVGALVQATSDSAQLTVMMPILIRMWLTLVAHLLSGDPVGAGQGRPRSGMSYRIEIAPAAIRQLRKLDRSAHRIVYEIHDGVLLVLVVAVGHRRDISQRR